MRGELVFGTLTKGVAAILGVLLTVIIASQYSTDEFAEFSIALSLLNFGIIVAAFGHPRKLARDTSRAFNSNELNRFSKIVTGLLKTNFLIALLFCLAIITAIIILKNYIGFSDLRTTLLISFIIIIPLVSLNLVLSEIIKGLGHVITSILVWNLFLNLSLIFLLYIYPLDIKFIGVYYVSAALINVIFAIYFLRKRNIKLTFSGVRIGRFPSFNEETKNFFTSDILREIKRWGIVLIVFPFLDATSIGIVLISKQVANVLMLIPYGLNSVLITKITKLFLRKNFNRIQQVLNLSVTLLSIISFSLFLPLFFFRENIITLFNNSYIGHQLTFLIICFSPLFSNTYGPIGVILNLCDKEEYVKKANYLSTTSLLVLGIIGSIFLESLGCALAILASTIFHNIYLRIIIKKQLSIVPRIELSSLRSISALQ